MSLSSPYPGLRPFTEEESIYYCGRELHIEVVGNLLEENKFLMVAGASGDGKSSLIFAGLLPNMQAGFFKAQHNRYLIASFRPERNPLQNFAKSLAHVFEEEDIRSLEARLGYGYSSLVDIFTSSKFNAEEHDEKSVEPANLVIYVDQFEEFFTYPENFSQGKASAEAQLVVNLLIETSRLALERNLPIYVVCTMRSDYIGQCSAFRGLAEYIGFSHYFVPRLNRLELKRVIEEPAALNGDDITPRLVERLLYDLQDGDDQLPVLQHALCQIWISAQEKGEAMDLLHYAKQGGMPAKDLPEDQQNLFSDWFNRLPTERKVAFENPGLGNVLNLHASWLFEEAKKIVSDFQLPGAEANNVVKGIFTCLTQIDKGRAVRNQMIAEEVLNILSVEQFGIAELDKTTRVFRSSGNTFLRPFIVENEGDQSDSSAFGSDTLLDITHESLIRNWKALQQWTIDENESRNTLIDLEKQVDRWTENKKKSGYLLPIGPLTYFENWFNSQEPNKYWLARYDESKIALPEKVKQAEERKAGISSFIKESASKLFATRFVMKHGLKKIGKVVFLALFIMGLICSSFWVWYTSNLRMIPILEARGVDFLEDEDISEEEKAKFLIYQELTHGKGTMKQILNEAEFDDTTKVRLALSSSMMLLSSKYCEPELGSETLMLADSLINKLPLEIRWIRIKYYAAALKICNSGRFYENTALLTRINNRLSESLFNLLHLTISAKNWQNFNTGIYFNAALDLIEHSDIEKMEQYAKALDYQLNSEEEQFRSLPFKQTSDNFGGYPFDFKDGGYKHLRLLFACAKGDKIGMTFHSKDSTFRKKYYFDLGPFGNRDPSRKFGCFISPLLKRKDSHGIRILLNNYQFVLPKDPNNFLNFFTSYFPKHDLYNDDGLKDVIEESGSAYFNIDERSILLFKQLQEFIPSGLVFSGSGLDFYWFRLCLDHLYLFSNIDNDHEAYFKTNLLRDYALIKSFHPDSKVITPQSKVLDQFENFWLLSDLKFAEYKSDNPNVGGERMSPIPIYSLNNHSLLDSALKNLTKINSGSKPLTIYFNNYSVKYHPSNTGIKILTSYSEISKKLLKSGVKPELLSTTEDSKLVFSSALRPSFLIEYGSKGDSILIEIILKSISNRDKNIKPEKEIDSPNNHLIWNLEEKDMDFLTSIFGNERVRLSSLVKKAIKENGFPEDSLDKFFAYSKSIETAKNSYYKGYRQHFSILGRLVLAGFNNDNFSNQILSKVDDGQKAHALNVIYTSNIWKNNQAGNSAWPDNLFQSNLNYLFENQLPTYYTSASSMKLINQFLLSRLYYQLIDKGKGEPGRKFIINEKLEEFDDKYLNNEYGASYF
jgi:hypothetical protein